MDATRILAAPGAFDLFQRLVGAPASKRRFVEREVALRPGERVLDLGCATGALLEYVPVGVEYLGVDLSEDYVDAARRRWGPRGTFVCADATEYRPDEPVDAVMAFGFFHHIGDEESRRVLAMARDSLRPSGRLVAAEPFQTPESGRLASFVMGLDRGKFVRTPEEWIALFETAFPSVRARVGRRELRIPYTLGFLEARRAG